MANQLKLGENIYLDTHRWDDRVRGHFAVTGGANGANFMSRQGTSLRIYSALATSAYGTLDKTLHSSTR